MSRKSFYAWMLLIVFCLNAYPIYQAVQNHGYLCYKNAYDEDLYLQYDFSLKNQRVTRLSQFLVTWGHESGISGGWLNLMFDALSVIGFLLLCRAIFRTLGYPEEKSNLASVLMTMIPAAFSGLNGFMAHFNGWLISSGTLYWVSSPNAAFLPILRTPEPQFSILLACACLLLSLKTKRFLFMYLCLPFLYPYVAMPVTFVLMALHLKSFFPWFSKRPLICLAVSFLTLSTLAWMNFTFFAPMSIKMYLTPTRLPLASFTFLLGIIFYGLLRKNVSAGERFVVLAFVFSVLAVQNSQVITGYIAHNANYEQYFGILGFAVVIVFAVLGSRLTKRITLVCLALISLTLYKESKSIFENNLPFQQKFVLDQELLKILKEDSPNLAINNVELASLASLVFPRQPATALSYVQTPGPIRLEDLERYLCIKKEILNDPAYRDKYAKVLKAVDEGYEHENMASLIIHNGRRKWFPINHDMDFLPANCQSVSLCYKVVE